MTEKTICLPQTAANPTDRYVAEVRHNGWIIDRAPFDTEDQAQTWLNSNNATSVQPSVMHIYSNMIKRWANK